MEASLRRPRGQSLACAFGLAIAALLASGSSAQAACQTDIDCANTPNCANDQPGQKDLTQFCTNSSDPLLGDDLSWNWDDTAFTSNNSNNTEDGCALYDTDGDGNANYSVCVTVGTIGSSTALQYITTTVYSCSDHKPDRCTSPNAVFSSPGTSCSVTNPSNTDPFPTGTDSPNDTRATCHIQTTQLVCDPNQSTPCDPTLLNVCSFPSQQPGSDPEDCILIPGPTNACDVDLDCNDGNACTNDVCDTNATPRVCVYSAVVCTPDDNPCTDTICVAPTGCQNVNDNTNTCDDGISCTTNSCVDGTCVATPHNENCTPDDNPCTDTVCTVGVGCQNVNDNSNTCDDGISCTTNACVDGTCVPTPHNDACTPDDNPCTDTVCTIGVGCQNVNDNSNSCSDNIACTTDACVDGTCVSTPHNENCTPDSNPCTDTVCTLGVGCQNVNDDTNTCTDNIACTTDACVGGRCSSTPDNSKCNDAVECTKDICDPQTGCQNPFDNDNTNCVLETCRTAGFWSTHGDLTGTLIADAGCLSICGERIDDVKAPAGKFKGSADSALEAMCVPVQGDSKLQLARQLTAAALNCIISNCVPADSNADCSNSSIADTFSQCNTICADPNATKADITSCIAAIDCFNNGGIFNPGPPTTCRTGTCSASLAPCGIGFPSCAASETCRLLATSCELQPLTNSDCGFNFEPPGKATTSKQCNDATNGACTVVGPGENQCSENTETACTPQ